MPHLIKIRSQTQDSRMVDLWRILESLFPVTFVSGPEGSGTVAGEIISEAVQSLPDDRSNMPVSCFSVPEGNVPMESGCLTEITVRFADDPDVPFPFQGRTLNTWVATAPRFLTLGRGEKILAQNNQGVLWSLNELNGVRTYRTAFMLPIIPPNGNLADILHGQRFLELLPLLDFLRHICGFGRFQRPPVRAQFMFDDPNLHWPTYGLVDYREIARRAEKENYHVSFATVPLDAWFTHQGTADLFRRNPTRLSLCIHGNDHTKKELAQNYSQAERVRVLQQAIRRIARLEQQEDIEVARVMVPPHGACSHEMLAEMVGTGFEAACISHGSLRAHNRDQAWAKSLGYLPSEQIEGCSVLPRWGFTGSTEATVLLAAFLDQPIILRGHHLDLKGGIELLDEFARIINRLGEVRWTNLTGISRQSYFWRLQSGVLQVSPLTRKIEVSIPDNTTELLLETTAVPGRETWKITTSDGGGFKIHSGAKFLLPKLSGKTVIFETIDEPTPPVSSPDRWPAKAFFRRVLTEGRDRFQGIWRVN